MRSQSLKSVNYGLILFLTLQLAIPILSTDIYLSSLKEISDIFHVNYSQVQLTLTLYFLIFGVVQLFYGPLSDRFGRKPILLFSLFIYNVATLACLFSTTIQMLIIGRCLQALGAGGAILVFAIIRDLYEGTRAAKLLAFMSAVVALSPIIAPIIGGYIQLLLSWRGDFAVLFIVGLTLWSLNYWLVPETNSHRENLDSFCHQSIRNYKRLLINRNYLCNAFSAAFAFAALFAYVSGAPYILLNLMNYPPQSFGWVFAIGAIGYVIGAWMNGKLVSRMGLNFMSWLGIASLVGGSIIMIIFCYFYSIGAMSVVVPQIICEFGISIVISTSIVKALQPIPQYAGAGSALIGFLRFMLATLSSYLVVEFHRTTPLPFAVIILILAFSSLACLVASNLHLKLNDKCLEQNANQ